MERVNDFGGMSSLITGLMAIPALLLITGAAVWFQERLRKDQEQ